MGKNPSDRYLRSCPQGTILFEDGQPGDRMFVIQTGRVQIVKRIGDVRFPFASLGPGDCVGEMSLLDGQPRSADAIVTEDATLVEIERATFEQLVRDNGEVAVRIMRKLSERLRDANRTIEGFLARNGALVAVKMLQAMTPPGDGPRALPPEATPQLLASRAGMPLNEASAVWERLKAAGVLSVDGERARLASSADVDAYVAYLELKQRYDPMTARELAEVTGLGEEEVHRVVRRLLSNRLVGAASGLVDSYQQYLTLKRRFEYPDRA